MIFKSALDKAFGFSDTIIVEDFIEGREVRCSVIEKFGKDSVEILALPVQEYHVNPEKTREFGIKVAILKSQILPFLYIQRLCIIYQINKIHSLYRPVQPNLDSSSTEIV